MTTALIDNATVSSIQRALGKAKLRDLGVLDIEQAALGRFAEAMLLCDRVVVPDNYKEQFTPARKKLLSALGVEFLPVPEPLDTALNAIARDLAEPWREAYKEGQDRTLFNEYFGQVQAFSKFIWEHSSSEFFLVFRAHGVEKESPLIEALLSSPKDDDLGRDLQIYAKNGKVVEWDKMSRHVQRMLAVMGWLGHQYIWHQSFAAKHDLAYMPHPLRDFFANDFLSRVNIGATSASKFDSVFSNGFAKFRGTLHEGLEKLGRAPSSINIPMPTFLPLLVKESRNGDEFIQVLGQVRKEKKVVELREMLSEANNQSELGNYAPLSKISREIEIVGQNFLLERGVDQRIIRLAPPTTLVGIKVEGDDSAIRMRMPSALYKQYFLTKRYRAFIRDVMAELAAPAQFGALKTKMNGWVWAEQSESDFSGAAFYTKDYRFPSLYHKPLDFHEQD
jgi:hypothetical protein